MSEMMTYSQGQWIPWTGNVVVEPYDSSILHLTTTPLVTRVKTLPPIVFEGTGFRYEDDWSYLFADMANLREVPPILGAKPPKYLTGTFRNCKSLTSFPAVPSYAAAQNADSAFEDVRAPYPVNDDLVEWDLDALVSGKRMFYLCKSFGANLHRFKLGALTSAGSMFYGSSLEQAELDFGNTARTLVIPTFRASTGLASLKLTGSGLSQLSDYTAFLGCTSLEMLSIDCSGVTRGPAAGFFDEVTSLGFLELTELSTSYAKIDLSKTAIRLGMLQEVFFESLGTVPLTVSAANRTIHMPEPVDYLPNDAIATDKNWIITYAS